MVQEILTKIGFDWRLALASLVNFLIIFWILKKYFFGALGDVIEERRTRIEGGLRDAQESEAVREDAVRVRERLLVEARREAEDILVHARSQAKTLEERAKKKIVVLRNEEMKRAHEEIAREREELLAGVAAAAGDLVARGMKQAVGEELDAPVRERIGKRLVNA